MGYFVVAMGYVALAVMDFERHKLAGLVNWYGAMIYGRSLDELVELVELKGLEPSTSPVRTERSPIELQPHI